MGEAVSRGLPDLPDMALDRFVAFMWWWATNGREQKDVDKFRARLWQPPAGEAPAENSPWDPKNETKAFQSLKARVAPG